MAATQSARSVGCKHHNKIGVDVVAAEYHASNEMKTGRWTPEEQQKEIGSAMAIATTANLLLGLGSSKPGKKFEKMMVKQIGMANELYDGGSKYILIPMMPFAVELCLKSIKAQGNCEFMWTHNLRLLWQDLSENDRNNIRSILTNPIWVKEESRLRFACGITPNIRSVNQIIEDHKNDFMDWRYVVDGERKLKHDKSRIQVLEGIMDLYAVVMSCVRYHQQRRRSFEPKVGP